MKPGLSYAFSLIVAVLLVVIMAQQRKLSSERSVNATLRGDARARVTSYYSEVAEMQREIRQLRSENDQLKSELDRLRERSPVRGSAP
jgi:predicted RNase H-like nuclease (RuvC/YqgF family)